MKTIYFLSLILLLTNCTVRNLDIEKITFQADPCEGECPIFTMTILNDGTAKYGAEMFNKLQGEFKTIIVKKQLDSLMNSIEEASFFSLKENYTMHLMDNPTYTLTVKLKSGETKTIKDYGPSGPEKLKAVYERIFSLRETQDWK